MLRGVAIVWMVAYHFCFDLRHHGLALQGHSFVHDPLWTLQRTAIVSLFLLCAGLGQALAEHAGQGWPRFWRRWAQVVVCAAAVSAGSALMFPRSWISFGVLHGMAVMLLLTRLVAPRLGTVGLLALGALALALPWLVQHPVFDTRATNWVGLVTRKPVTEDFVPVLPWWGVVLWGLAVGRIWLARRAPMPPPAPVAAVGRGQGAGHGHAHGGVEGLVRRLAAGLALLGRWPLTVYMLHQPLMIAGLWLWMHRG